MYVLSTPGQPSLDDKTQVRGLTGSRTYLYLLIANQSREKWTVLGFLGSVAMVMLPEAYGVQVIKVPLSLWPGSQTRDWGLYKQTAWT